MDTDPSQVSAEKIRITLIDPDEPSQSAGAISDRRVGATATGT
jgi:hypothetical protein